MRIRASLRANPGPRPRPPDALLTALAALLALLVPAVHADDMHIPPEISDECIRNVAVWLNARDNGLVMPNRKRSVWFEKRATIVVAIFLAIFIVLIIGMTVFLHARTADEDEDVGISSPSQSESASSLQRPTGKIRRRIVRHTPVYVRSRLRRRKAAAASRDNDVVSPVPTPARSTAVRGRTHESDETQATPADPQPAAQPSSVDMPYDQAIDRSDVEAVDSMDLGALAHPPAYHHSGQSRAPQPDTPHDAHVATDDKRVFDALTAAASAPPTDVPLAHHASAPPAEPAHGKGKHRALSEEPHGGSPGKQREIARERRELASLVSSAPDTQQLPLYIDSDAAQPPPATRPWNALLIPPSAPHESLVDNSEAHVQIPSAPPVPSAPVISSVPSSPVMPSAPPAHEILSPAAATAPSNQPSTPSDSHPEELLELRRGLAPPVMAVRSQDTLDTHMPM